MKNLWLILREIKWITVLALAIALFAVGAAIAGGTMVWVVSLVGLAIVLALVDRE
jgi:hypothetical protein